MGQFQESMTHFNAVYRPDLLSVNCLRFSLQNVNLVPGYLV